MPPRVRYQTVEIGSFDIHVCSLWDAQQYADDGGRAESLGIGSATWSTFGVVWDSGRTLARVMSDYEGDGRRILEVGCGIGLASLVLNKRGLDVTATDHHPDADAFLQRNAALNGGPAIPFVRAGWDEDPAFEGPFDLVIASDVLYERGHAEALSAFIDRQTTRQSEVIMVDPGRKQTARFSGLLRSQGYQHEELRSSPDEASRQRIIVHSRDA